LAAEGEGEGWLGCGIVGAALASAARLRNPLTHRESGR
jgi:hypothetical protein